jgi:signal transduction histidine kinase/ActR/RegA family two-component response regulator
MAHLMPAPRRSLRRKLLVIVMASTLSALSVSALALLLYQVHDYRRDGISDLTSQADLIAQSVTPTLVFDDAKAAQEALLALQRRPQILAAAVYRADGALFARYVAGAGDPAELPARVGAEGAHYAGTQLSLFHRIEQSGEHLGTVYLRARYDILSQAVGYLFIVGMASLAGLGLAALIYRRLHPSITRPILAVAEASRNLVEDGNYDIRVHEASDDEVGVLVEAFNNMVGGLATEMRQRRDAEEALKEADRRKDEFLATLSHELRNPMSPMLNAITILRRSDDNPALRAKAREILERQMGLMVRLIDDLMEVSRITRGKLDLRREPVDVVALARGALEAAEPALQKKGHTVESRWPSEAPWVDADPQRLMQVLVNVLHNAAKYTDAGGRVRLTVRAEGGSVHIEVADNGIGIAPEQQQAVFGMFVQLDTSLERGAAGLGIGLTIARQLVAMHGGRLEVHSDGLGRGSTFTIVLPSIPAPLAADAADRSGLTVPSEARSGLRILVADDNIDFADSFASVLRDEGHQVRVAHNGADALVLALGEAAPQVAFLDIGMPGLNGLALAQRLRATPHGASMTLVAVTGWGQETDRQRVLRAGFDHHWVKPMQIDAALRLLAGCVRSGRA